MARPGNGFSANKSKTAIGQQNGLRSSLPEQVVSSYSTAIMTLEALITAKASRPTASWRD
jgi:hypothetical protein